MDTPKFFDDLPELNLKDINMQVGDIGSDEEFVSTPKGDTEKSWDGVYGIHTPAKQPPPTPSKQPSAVRRKKELRMKSDKTIYNVDEYIGSFEGPSALGKSYSEMNRKRRFNTSNSNTYGSVPDFKSPNRRLFFGRNSNEKSEEEIGTLFDDLSPILRNKKKKKKKTLSNPPKNDFFSDFALTPQRNSGRKVLNRSKKESSRVAKNLFGEDEDDESQEKQDDVVLFKKDDDDEEEEEDEELILRTFEEELTDDTDETFEEIEEGEYEKPIYFPGDLEGLKDDDDVEMEQNSQNSSQCDQDPDHMMSFGTPPSDKKKKGRGRRRQELSSFVDHSTDHLSINQTMQDDGEENDEERKLTRSSDLLSSYVGEEEEEEEEGTSLLVSSMEKRKKNVPFVTDIKLPKPNPFSPKGRMNTHGSSRIKSIRFQRGEDIRKSLSSSLIQEEAQICPYFSRYLDTFEEVKVLGKGNYGVVTKVKSRFDGLFYAVKYMTRMIKGPHHEQEVLREVHALAQLRDTPNIVKYYSSWIENSKLFIQTEFCEGPTLYEKRFKQDYVFKESELIDIIRQIAMGLHSMHSRTLCHLDLKPENIFVTQFENTVQYKIGDLGLVSSVIELDKDLMEGDNRYLSREVLNYSSGIDLSKVDIFALGATVLEMAIGTPLPTDTKGWGELRDGRIPFHKMTQYSSPFKDLLKSMLHENPKIRPSTAQILQHKLILEQSISWHQLFERNMKLERLLIQNMKIERKLRQEIKNLQSDDDEIDMDEIENASSSI